MSSRATDAKAGGSSLLVFACKKGVARHWKKGISDTLAEDLNPPTVKVELKKLVGRVTHRQCLTRGQIDLNRVPVIFHSGHRFTVAKLKRRQLCFHCITDVDGTLSCLFSAGLECAIKLSPV